MKRIAVIGGSGFVGTHLIVKLAKKYDEVSVVTRRRHRFKALRVLNNVATVEADVHNDTALREAIRGADAVVNLAGILNQGNAGGKNSFESVHSELTRRLLIASMDTNVSRFIQISALNADARNGSSEYLRSKGLAEQHIHQLAEDIEYTIFQPSVIFGEGDSFFNRFAGLLQNLPFLPLACPDARLAPVYVDDVCTAVCNAMQDPDTFGATIPLCGPTDYSLKQLIEITRDTLGLSRPIIGLPDFAARLQARVMEWVPGQPFTRDNYLSLQTDNVCPAECPRQPTALETIVPTYIGVSGRRARQQASRRMARRDV